MYFLSVLAVFKDESGIIKEWVEHYIKEGVEHFFLVNNDSTDDYLQKIEEFKDKITFYHDSSCRHAYSIGNYMVMNKDKSKWFIIADLDEFIYAQQGTIKEYLQTVPEDVSSVGVVWKRFGSSGHIEQPDKIIPNFTWRRDVSKAQYYEELKTIVRGEKFVAMESSHNCALKDGKTILSNGEVIPNNHCVDGFTEERMKTCKLHLNHYMTQSRNYYVNFKIPRHNGPIHGEGYFTSNDIKEIEDTQLKDKRYPSLSQKEIKYSLLRRV